MKNLILEAPKVSFLINGKTYYFYADNEFASLLSSLAEEATSRAEVMARRLAHSDSVRRTQFGEEEALRIVNGVLESGRTISPLGKPFMVEISAKDVKNRLG